MAQASSTRAWDLHVERGPDWLFVRPSHAVESATEPAFLAEQIWSLLEQSFTYRLVLELADVEDLDSLLIEQLLWLNHQIRGHNGTLRLCGLPSSRQNLLAEAGGDAPLAVFRDREAAVMGHERPGQPR